MAKGLDAGNAYVTVTVDTSQFSRGLNTSVRKSLKGAEGDANKSMSGIAGAAMGLTKVGALAVGAAAVGAIGAIGKLGMEYQNSLNIFQAATSATAAQMEKVRTVAKALGNDITLPGVSAKDAALAMTELAKGGLSVESSMRAAKGTLQLATAAQIDGAAAAEIQANALAMFGLKADAAAHVADVLANVANAASGEITDFALSLKYVGPIARSAGISIDHTAAALGVLANAGIKGEQAGTTLRDVLRSLSAPSSAGAKALKTLGVQAYDSNHKFVGFKKIIEELTAAQKRMSQQGFAKATSDAFGVSMTGVMAIVQQGPKAFDDMTKAVGKTGGAAQLAAAKSKGLAGAWDSLKSTLETIGITLFEKFGPYVEKALKKINEAIPGVMKKIEDFAKKVKKAAEDFAASPLGQSIRKALDEDVPQIKTQLEEFGKSVKSFVDGFLEGWKKVEGNKTLKDLVDDIQKITDTLKPLTKALGDNKDAANGWGLTIAVVVGGSLTMLETQLHMVADALDFLKQHWDTVKDVAIGAGGPVTLFWDQVKAGGQTVMNFITGSFAPNMIKGVERVKSGFDTAVVTTAGWAGTIKDTYQQVVVTTAGWAGTIRNTVVNGFSQMWTTAGNLARNGTNVVVGFFSGLLTRGGVIVGQIRTSLVGAFGTMWSTITSTVSVGVGRVVQFVVGIKSKITGAFAGAGSWLINAGRDIIDGVVSGIRGAFHLVEEAIGALKRLIPDWATRFFKSGSPARIMLGPGRSIGEGLAAGIDASHSMVEKAVGQLADTARSIGPVTVPVVADADLHSGRRAGRAAPLDQLSRVSAVGGAPAVQITVNGALDPNAVGKQVVELLRREGRFRTRPVLAGG